MAVIAGQIAERRARKQHVCEECNGIIAKGEIYVDRRHHGLLGVAMRCHRACWRELQDQEERERRFCGDDIDPEGPGWDAHKVWL